MCFSIYHLTLQVCVLEAVAGLQASVLADRGNCLDSPDIAISVSLERGTPVLLLFSLTGDGSSYSETREMNTRKDIFHIEHPIQGMVESNYYTWVTLKSSQTTNNNHFTSKN